MQSTNPNLPQVIDGCHELLKWLIPVLDKFPRARRFTLGERLESGLLAVLGECVDAAYSKHKHPQTQVANRHCTRHCTGSGRTMHAFVIIFDRSAYCGSTNTEILSESGLSWLTEKIYPRD